MIDTENINFPSAQGITPDDYYVEDGYRVFKATYLLRRGYCCRGGCRHCPYPKGKYHK